MGMVYVTFHGSSPLNYAMKKIMAMDVVINIKLGSAINALVCLGINSHYSHMHYKLMVK